MYTCFKTVYKSREGGQTLFFWQIEQHSQTFFQLSPRGERGKLGQGRAGTLDLIQ